jgi:hypothetical protein
MALMGTQPRRIARSGPGFAYLMTGIALACICVSGVLGSIFTPALVTGAQHQHIPIAAFTGWIWNVIAIGMVVTVAMRGIRAEATDKAPWTMLGLGVGAIWLGVMFVAIFAPVWVTGTDPDKLPVWAGLSAIAGVILTGILCNFVKTASFRPAESKAASATTSAEGLDSAAEDATVKLRRLAQLRDSGAITEAEFQAKKNDLLSRI